MGYNKKPPLIWRNAQTVGIVPPTGGVSYLTFGDQAFEVKSTLEASLGKTGLGGMLTGPATANTVYYVYAILSGQTPKLAISLRDPTVGPGGTWTYLGAFFTYATSAYIPEFKVCNGRFQSCVARSCQVSQAGAVTAKTIVSPETTIFSIGELILGGSSGLTGWIAGGPNTVTPMYVIYASSAVEVYMFCVVPLSSPTTVYLQSDVGATIYWRVCGWIEDPELYP